MNHTCHKLGTKVVRQVNFIWQWKTMKISTMVQYLHYPPSSNTSWPWIPKPNLQPYSMDENERCWCASTLNRWYIRSLQPMSPQITPPRMASHQEARHQKFSNIWTCSSTGLNNVPHIACLKCSGEEDQKTNWFTQANITLGCTTYECKINTLLIPNSNNNTPKWQELE